VPGVGEQRQAAGPEPHDRFNDTVAECQAQRGREHGRRGAAVVVVVAVMVGVGVVTSGAMRRVNAGLGLVRVGVVMVMVVVVVTIMTVIALLASLAPRVPRVLLVRSLLSMCVVAHRVVTVAFLAVGRAHTVQDGTVRAPAQGLMRRGSLECGNRRSR
jgi:hypothetical protein